MPLRPVLAIAFCVALGACATNAPTTGGTGSTASAAQGTSAAEADLRRREAALRRTLREGVATGVVATTLVANLFQDSDRALGTGLSIGGPAGLAAGTYVAALQRNYATKERRLGKLRDDIRATNAQAEAAIVSMRAVLAQQRQELAAARATGGGTLTREQAEAQANLGSMRGLVTATEARRQEVLSTRTLDLVPGQQTGVDAEVAQLSQRIGTMREIAELLAAEI